MAHLLYDTQPLSEDADDSEPLGDDADGAGGLRMTLSLSTQESTCDSLCSGSTAMGAEPQCRRLRRSTHSWSSCSDATSVLASRSCSSSSLESEAKELSPGTPGNSGAAPPTIHEMLGRLLDLSGRAAAVSQRLDAYASGNAARVKGLMKLKRRVQKELSTVTAMRSLCERELRWEGTHTLPSPLVAAQLRPYVKCEGITHLELIMAVMEVEVGVVEVSVVVKSCAECRGAAASAQPRHASRREVGTGGSGVYVDVVSCHGLRWIKVKTASTRSMRLDGTQCAHDAPSFTRVMRHIVRAAKCTALPFGLRPQVCALFLRSPPRRLRETLRTREDVIVRVVKRARSAGASFNDARWCDGQYLPPLELPVQFVNFDVTALVALCSEMCYAEEATSLPQHRVLDEQIRKETATEQAVRGFIEPTLYSHTSVLSEIDLAFRVRRAIGHELGESMAAARGESGAISAVKVIRVDVERLVTAPGAEVSGGLSESTAVRDFRAACGHDTMVGARAVQSFPNWIVSDVALGEFLWIVNTIAGPREVERAKRLLRLVHVVTTPFLTALLTHSVSPSESLAVPGRGADRKLINADPMQGTWIDAPPKVHHMATGTLLERAANTFSDGDSSSCSSSTANTSHDHAKGRAGEQSPWCLRFGASYPAGATSPDWASHADMLPRVVAHVPCRVFRSLSQLSSINNRNALVFGLGDAVRAITLSANRKVGQIAQDEHMHLCIAPHPPRALIEKKILGLRRRDGPTVPPTVESSQGLHY